MLEKATMSTLLGDRMKDLFSGFFKEFSAEVLHVVKNQLLEYQVEEYNRNAMVKTLLHRVNPVPLKDIYQPLFIRKWERDGHRKIYSGSKRITTNHAKELFMQQQCITLIGDAGSGKSTIIRHLFLDCINASFRIPVKIELRYLNEFEGSITEYIREKIFKLQKLATNDRIIERMLRSGDLIFFLDGYDELKSNIRERVTREIDDLVKVYNRNCYMLTTRPFTEVELMPMFHNMEVCELSMEEIPVFVRKQFTSSDNEVADKIIATIEQSEDRVYNSFLGNPLLLSMFILSYQSYSSVPQKKSQFYNQVFDTLFSTHDSLSKLGYVREKASGLSKDQLTEVLKLFSFLSFFDERYIFTHLYFAGRLNFIKEKKADLQFENSQLLYDLQVSIGILKAEGIDLAFPHRSLQEYFASLYIASLKEENKVKIYNKLKERNIEWYYIDGRRNFFELLHELDPRGFIQHMVLPIGGRLLEYLSREGIHALLQEREKKELFSELSMIAHSLPELLITEDAVDYLLAVKMSDEGWLRTRAEKMEEEIDLIVLPARKLLQQKLKSLTGFLESEKQTEHSIVSYIDIPS